MCETCGCGEPDNNHTHIHDHEHEHDHDHVLPENRKIQLEKDVLYKNNLTAERDRGYFEAKNILALNMVSSPGSGKTSILERTVRDFEKDIPMFVIVGDQQGDQDSERLRKAGVSAIQINTGMGCHLDAGMINKILKTPGLRDHSVLFIENVGNLVCPALFDLGESRRVLIMSVTEGEDKPLKYPYMFHSSHLCLINKTDLLPYVDFSLQKAREYALKINPSLEFIEISAKTGEGMTGWYKWIQGWRK